MQALAYLILVGVIVGGVLLTIKMAGGFKEADNEYEDEYTKRDIW